MWLAMCPPLKRAGGPWQPVGGGQLSSPPDMKDTKGALVG